MKLKKCEYVDENSGVEPEILSWGIFLLGKKSGCLFAWLDEIRNKGCVTHGSLAIYIKKYLKAKKKS
jgi:hypothetical protein